jgi:hypothetical protein
MENSFGLLPMKRKQELQNLYYEGKLSLSKLTPVEQQLFYGFAKDQSKLTLWMPIWALNEFVPDIDIIGRQNNIPNPKILAQIKRLRW